MFAENFSWLKKKSFLRKKKCGQKIYGRKNVAKNFFGRKKIWLNIDSIQYYPEICISLRIVLYKIEKKKTEICDPFI